jgi:hypothetical protein
LTRRNRKTVGEIGGSGFTSLPDDGKKGFDFGWVSLPLMFVLGIIIGFVINKVRKH